MFIPFHLLHISVQMNNPAISYIGECLAAMIQLNLLPEMALPVISTVLNDLNELLAMQQELFGPQVSDSDRKIRCSRISAACAIVFRTVESQKSRSASLAGPCLPVMIQVFELCVPAALANECAHFSDIESVIEEASLTLGVLAEC